MALLVSVTPAFTSICAVAMSWPTRASNTEASSIRAAPRPGVSLCAGTLTETILPSASTAISTVNGWKPVTS